MLNFMSENKRILNLHEQKYAELAVFQANTTVFQANTNASLKNLETQVGQLALTMQNQSRDAFPSDTKKNPKDGIAITLRSGKELQSGNEVEQKQLEDGNESRNQSSTSSEKRQGRNELSDENQLLKEQGEMTIEKTVQKEEVRAYQPPIPFPQRLKQSKMDGQYARFLNMFKKLQINIPFVEALARMPHYEKFMKDIINKKRKLDEGGVVNLFSTYNAIIQKNMPQKMQDPGSVIIPCTIGNHEIEKALCDSGASIHLMPLLIVKRVSLGELTPTKMSL